MRSGYGDLGMLNGLSHFLSRERSIEKIRICLLRAWNGDSPYIPMSTKTTSVTNRNDRDYSTLKLTRAASLISRPQSVCGHVSTRF